MFMQGYIGKHARHGPGELTSMPHMVLEDWQVYSTWSWRIGKCATHGPGRLASRMPNMVKHATHGSGRLASVTYCPGGLSSVPHMNLEDWQACHTQSGGLVSVSLAILILLASVPLPSSSSITQVSR